MAVHIDEDDMSPELSLIDGDPCLVIRLQPMTGGLCRLSYATAANDGEGRALIDMAEVDERIVTTSEKCCKSHAETSSSPWRFQVPHICQFLSNHAFQSRPPLATFSPQSRCHLAQSLRSSKLVEPESWIVRRVQYIVVSPQVKYQPHIDYGYSCLGVAGR